MRKNLDYLVAPDTVSKLHPHHILKYSYTSRLIKTASFQTENAPIRPCRAFHPIREDRLDHRWRIWYLLTFQSLSFSQTNLPRHRPFSRTAMPHCRRQSPHRRPPLDARSARMVLIPPKVNVPLSEMQRRRLGPTARSDHRINHAVRECPRRVRPCCRYLRAAVEQFLGRQ